MWLVNSNKVNLLLIAGDLLKKKSKGRDVVGTEKAREGSQKISGCNHPRTWGISVADSQGF